MYLIKRENNVGLHQSLLCNQFPAINQFPAPLPTRSLTQTAGDICEVEM